MKGKYMSLSRFDHSPNYEDYDPAPAMSPEEAANWLDGVREFTPEPRTISDEAVKTMQRALDHLQAKPENPSED